MVPALVQQEHVDPHENVRPLPQERHDRHANPRSASTASTRNAPADARPEQIAMQRERE